MSDFPLFEPDGEDVEVVSREVIEHDEAITDRSLARRVSLQCLYGIDSVGHPIGTVLDNNINYSPERRRVKSHIEQIVRGVVSYRSALDSILQKYASEWPIDQVAVVELLPGVGKKTADAIIEYRSKNGNFKAVDDITKVKGIGAKKLEKIKSYLVLEGETTLKKK